VHWLTVFVSNISRWETLINVMVVRDRERQCLQVSFVV
jgi:hypothetical protein